MGAQILSDWRLSRPSTLTAITRIMRQHMRSRAYGGRVSTAVVLSYAFDWVIIIATAAVGAVFAKLPPNKRPFSITNPEISFPFVTNEKIPTWSLGIIACVAPACPWTDCSKVNTKTINLAEEVVGVAYRMARIGTVVSIFFHYHTRDEESVWKTSTRSPLKMPGRF